MATLKPAALPDKFRQDPHAYLKELNHVGGVLLLCAALVPLGTAAARPAALPGALACTRCAPAASLSRTALPCLCDASPAQGQLPYSAKTGQLMFARPVIYECCRDWGCPHGEECPQVGGACAGPVHC